MTSKIFGASSASTSTKINCFIRFLKLLQHSSAPQAKILVFSHQKLMFSIEKSMEINEKMKVNQKKSRPSADLIRKPPLFTNPHLNRGGFLIKGGFLINNTSDVIFFVSV